MNFLGWHSSTKIEQARVIRLMGISVVLLLFYILGAYFFFCLPAGERSL